MNKDTRGAWRRATDYQDEKVQRALLMKSERFGGEDGDREAFMEERDRLIALFNKVKDTLPEDKRYSLYQRIMTAISFKELTFFENQLNELTNTH